MNNLRSINAGASVKPPLPGHQPCVAEAARRANPFAHALADTLNELLLPALLPVIVAYFAVRGLPWIVWSIAQ